MDQELIKKTEERMSSGAPYEPAAPRKLLIDELETARAEVRSAAYVSDYCPTLKIMIHEAEIRARKSSALILS